MIPPSLAREMGEGFDSDIISLLFTRETLAARHYLIIGLKGSFYP